MIAALQSAGSSTSDLDALFGFPFFLVPAVDWRALELYDSRGRGPDMLGIEGQQVYRAQDFVSHVIKQAIYFWNPPTEFSPLESLDCVISILGCDLCEISPQWHNQSSRRPLALLALRHSLCQTLTLITSISGKSLLFSSMEQGSVSPTLPHRMTPFISTNPRLMPSIASLSRDLQSASSSPLLVHSLHETRSSVLSLAANENYIFSGSQNRDIAVRPTHSWKFVQECFKLTL